MSTLVSAMHRLNLPGRARHIGPENNKKIGADRGAVIDTVFSGLKAACLRQVAALQAEAGQQEDEVARLEATKPQELYELDLTAFEEALDVRDAQEAADNAALAAKQKRMAGGRAAGKGKAKARPDPGSDSAFSACWLAPRVAQETQPKAVLAVKSMARVSCHMLGVSYALMHRRE